jgi:hypothetical protein
MGLIVAGVAAVVAMGAPLAGFAVGVSGALAGMGAAAVLTFLGVRNAMASGTAAGNTFSAGLGILKGNLDTLSATAADTMLTHFQTSVSLINAGMPGLNNEIKQFSTMLGTTGNILLGTLISGFHTLLPLFIRAGVYIEQIAVGFQKWTSGGGLASFSQMAMTAIPQVAQALGSLLHGVVGVVGALAPFGTAMLGALTIVGYLLSGIAMLGPALSPIVGITLLVVGAFMLWKQISPIVDKVSVAVEKFGVATLTMWGVVGLAVAAVVYLAAAMVGNAAATDQATKSMDDYTSAIQQDNGVIGENTRLQAAKNLQQQGALAAAQHLGYATKTLTDATTGHSAAQAKLKADIAATTAKIDAEQKAMTGSGTASAKATREYDANWKALKVLTDAYKGNAGGIKDAIKAYNDVANAEGLTTIQTKAQFDAQTALANSYGDSLPAYMAAVAAQSKAGDQLQATTLLMQLQNDAAGLLKGALDNLNGKALSAADAQNAFDSSLANMGTHVTAAGKQITFTTDNIGNMSAASVALRGQLNGQIHNLEGVIEANGGLSNSTSGMKADYEKMRQAIIDNAVAHGVNRDAVTQYIDKIYAIPASVPPTRLDIDTSAVLSKLAALKSTVASVLADLAGAPAAAQTSVGVNLSAVQTPAQARWSIPGHADGGTVTGIGGPRADSVLRRMSVGEEVIRESAASQARPFLKAFNANPGKALTAVAASGNSSGGGDRPIYMDGSLFGVLRELANGEAQIVVNAASQKQKVGLANGMQRGLY